MRRLTDALILLVLVTGLAVGCGPRTGGVPPSGAAGAPSGDAAAPRRGPSVEEFYRGKTITVIVGLAPGGGFDTVSRLVARHIGKHIPGNPNVIVENMPGAGSLLAANHVYNVARPDGLTIGAFNELQIINQVTNAEGVEFDARRYGWVGAVQKSTAVCTIRTDTPYRTTRDLLRMDLPPLIVGATGPGAETHDIPKTLIGALNANMRVVAGYGGTAPIRLAVESREVDGLCWSYESVLATAQPWIDSGFATVIVYQSVNPDPRVEERFPGVLRAEDLAPDEQTRRLIRATAAPGAMAKPWFVPPNVPQDRLEALQKAFEATMKDPAFLAEAAQARVEVDPSTGPETARLVNEILDLPSDVAARLAEIRK